MIIRNRSPKLQPLADWKFSDLLIRLGDVSPDRIRLNPWPGQATDEDCSESKDRFGCLCEMVEGTLVEKVMGWGEARLATELARLIGNYLERNQLGIVMGPDGPVRIETRGIRMPDVTFISWDRLPEDAERLPEGSIMELPPDLAVEVISPSNRPGEMRVKRLEYFQRGTRLVWYIYFQDRYAEVYTSATEWTQIGFTEALDGRDVLPGFKVTLKKLYELSFPERPKKKRGK